MGICEGRVVIVTGGGRGIGKGHSIEFARQGAKVVVNDLGKERDDTGNAQPVAQQLIAYARERLAHFKCPKTVDFIDELPRHETGKLYRRLVREQYRQKAGAN